MSDQSITIECETDSGGQLRNAIYLLIRDARTFDPNDPTKGAKVMNLDRLHVATRLVDGALKQYLWVIADPNTLYDDPLSQIVEGTSCIYPAPLSPKAKTNNTYWRVLRGYYNTTFKKNVIGTRCSTIGQVVEPLFNTGALQFDQIVSI